MDTHSTAEPRPQTPRRRWRALAMGLALLAALTGAGWWWSGSEGSLAVALRVASRLLPSGMTLHTSEVRGSLRTGGRIGTAQWQQDGLTLDMHDLVFRLEPALLMQGQLPLQQVQLGRLAGHPQQASQTAPPMTTLVWPMKVALQWQIDSVHWDATVPVEASGLQGSYHFDGQAHRLLLKRLQWAQGEYQGELTLQARAPMALQAQVQGELRLASGPTAQRPLRAEARLQGTLGGAQALLNLQAELTHAPGGNGTAAPRLQLQAQIHPHGAQALTDLQARLQQIDLAPLWPGAPQTLLDGHITADAQDQGWQLDVDLRNRVTGPWDRGRIPLQALRARLLHQDTGWQVQALHARWPGGSAQGEGQWQASEWQGQWHIEQLQPGQWWSRWQGPALSGQVRARQTNPGQLDMAVGLQAAQRTGTGTATPSGLTAHIQRLQDIWTVPQLELHWAEAHLQAQGQWRPAHQQMQAQAQWQLPGMTGRIEGQLSPQQGQGQWQLDAQDPARLRAWLGRWPLTEAAQASGQWQGGWAGKGMQLQAQMASARLQLHTAGTLTQGAAAGAWRGEIAQLQLDGKPVPGTSARLMLQSPLAWQWLAPAKQLQWQAHRWSLAEANSPRTASLDMDAGAWQAPRRADGLPQARLQALVTELPLQWAQWLGLSVPAGDLVLKGQVDLRLDERLQLQARLERSRGDLQVSTDLPQTPRVQAGIRTALATLQVDGTQAGLELAWDSAQAGQLDARLRSQIDPATPEGLAGLWPATAPLSGQVNASLPRVGAWAWLAPPGWRVQGSLDARFDLAGTRAQPQWRGTLQADNLAVRSAVEGIEFRQGRLRARLQEQQIQLEEFRLLGAGAQGGEVSAQGLVRWLPQTGSTLQAVQMDLQMQARALRVSSRADRRLSVSGQVRARLERGQMQLRGELMADSALFILSDDSTPTLGKDVVVVHAPTPTQASPPSTPAGLSVMGTPDVQVLLQLGPDFQLRGQGLSTRLAGQVRLSSNAATGGQPSLAGRVQTEGGRYKAYGQQLDIEQGLLVFSGPYDNPALDILALRPNLGQRVGVRVTGSAMTPRVRPVSYTHLTLPTNREV